TISVGDTPVAALPALGLGSASHSRPLSVDEANRLRTLKLDHLRVDLDLSKSDLGETLTRAAKEATTIQAALEIALFLGEDVQSELAVLQSAVKAIKPQIARWLLFARYTNITPASLV